MDVRCLYIVGCLFVLPFCGEIDKGLRAQNMQEEFDAYLTAITGEFYTYLDSIDLVFAQMLEDEWTELLVYEGTEPPRYGRSPSDQQRSLPSTAAALSGEAEEDAAFYGQPVTLPAPPLPAFTLGSLSEKGVADAWRTLYRTNFTTLLAGVNRYCQSLALNDWGKYLFVRYAVDSRFPSCPPQERTLLLSYLLLHTGLEVKMAFANQGLVLLLPLREEVYQTAFVRIGDRAYYLPDAPEAKVKRVFASAHAYPGEVRPASLALTRPLAFAYDRHLIRFYATWPLCDLSVYFRARPVRSFRQRMDETVGRDLSGKAALEQVALLLSRVQQQATHIPDDRLHGREVYYFPEETAFLGQADCEDLSVWLYWLIRTYTACRTVALLYPNHVAVAIEAPAGYDGKALVHNGIRYILCDPSYKGAPMGEGVPSAQSATPVVVSYP